MKTSIESLMHDFYENILGRYTPCRATDIPSLALSISIVHVEFILIHPFREGNGRIARLIADIMALQAGYPLLNFVSISTDNPESFQNYIKAIHSGMDKDYVIMQKLFIKIISDSMKKR